MFYTYITMKTRLISWLALGAMLVLPALAHSEPQAPYLNVKRSSGFFLNPTEEDFANGLPLYQNLYLQLGFTAYSYIDQSGFNSVANQTGGDLFFTANPLTLAEYAVAGEDTAGYAVYRPLPDSTGFTTAFYRWVNAADVLVAGQILWYRIDSENSADTTPVISALFRFTTINNLTSDPLAQAFYDELMLLTNGTGYLHFRSEPISGNIVPEHAVPPHLNVGDYDSWFSGILTPVPEPTTVGMLLAAAAIACTALVRRRK